MFVSLLSVGSAGTGCNGSLNLREKNRNRTGQDGKVEGEELAQLTLSQSVGHLLSEFALYLQ